MADSILTAPAGAVSAPAAGAAPAGTTGTPGGTTPAPGAADWMAAFEPDVREAITAKGYKSVADVGRGWLSASKLVGVDPAQVLKLPGKDADAAAWEAVYAKLGRPEKPDGYSLPEALAKDPVAADFRTAAHAAGLSTKQAEALLNWYTGATDKVGQTMAEQTQAQQAKRLEALQREVGPGKWDSFLEESRRAARVLVPESYKDPATGEALTRADILAKMEGAIGTDLAVRIMQAAAAFTVSEDKTEGGSPKASGIMSGEAARARKAELRNDKAWLNRWANGDADARKEMARLDAIIAGA